jgi:hypothetical protein
MESGCTPVLMEVRAVCVIRDTGRVLTDWSEYESIVPLVQTSMKSSASIMTTRTRRDFARELYSHCNRCDQTAGRSFCSKNATWFSVLRAAIKYTGDKDVS